jgi:hypothetical protein
MFLPEEFIHIDENQRLLFTICGKLLKRKKPLASLYWAYEENYGSPSSSQDRKE